MRERSKRELVDEAEAAGVADAEDRTKEQLEAELDARHPAVLGPTVRPGEETPAFEPSGRGVKGVAPMTAEEIPEAGR